MSNHRPIEEIAAERNQQADEIMENFRAMKGDAAHEAVSAGVDLVYADLFVRQHINDTMHEPCAEHIIQRFGSAYHKLLDASFSAEDKTAILNAVKTMRDTLIIVVK